VSDDGRGLTDEFWASARAGVLVRPVCQVCGRSFFTPKPACPHCWSEDWRYEPSSGRGTVATHTTIERGPDETWPVPYVLGVVDVEEGWDLLTRLLVDPEALGDRSIIGRAVRVELIDDVHVLGRRLPAFALTDQLEEERS